MKQRLPLILSITALVVALLGWTGVGEATRNALVPKNSVGPAQIKKKAVKSKHLAPGTVFNLQRPWVKEIRRMNDRVSDLEGATAAPTSADLAELESRVDTIFSRLGSSLQRTGIEGGIQNVRSDLSSLDLQVSSVKRDLSSLDSEVSTLRSKTLRMCNNLNGQGLLGAFFSC